MKPNLFLSSSFFVFLLTIGSNYFSHFCLRDLSTDPPFCPLAIFILKWPISRFNTRNRYCIHILKSMSKNEIYFNFWKHFSYFFQIQIKKCNFFTFFFTIFKKKKIHNIMKKTTNKKEG